jgi:hypothetical protein
MHEALRSSLDRRIAWSMLGIRASGSQVTQREHRRDVAGRTGLDRRYDLRTASVSRTDVRHVRVVVSGPVGVRPRLFDPLPGPFLAEFRYTPAELADLVRTNRLMVARLQRRDPDISTDLGWRTVALAELEVKGTGKNAFEAAWVGSLTSPVNIPLRRPGDTSSWRVGIEEWERLPGDPADLSEPRQRPVWERRLVYADYIPL